jgi:hypothetical protein
MKMKNNILKNYSIESSFLFRLRNRSKLEKILGVPKGSLKKKTLVESRRYQQFDIPKSGSKGRHIENPNESLKCVHRRLLRLLQRIETPIFLKSGKKGCSYIENAKEHMQSKHVLTVDIKKFYPHCRQKHIFEMFKNTFKMTPDIAGALTRLVSIDGHLPTGSPVSQILAYWTYNDMFDEIEKTCKKNSIIFSLYVDDMTFSSQTRIESNFLNDIKRIVRRRQLKLKDSKEKYYDTAEFKVITGVAISPANELLVPNKLRSKILNEFELLKSETCPNKEKSLRKLEGLLGSAKQIEPNIFPDIQCFIKKQK